MTDAAASARAAWAERFSDELLGFEHVPMADMPEPEPTTAAAKAAAEKRGAAERARRARAKAKRASELDRAIAEGLVTTMRKRRLPDKVAAAGGFGLYGVLLENLFAEARDVLVLDCGWPREAALRALNARLLRTGARE